jgi:hypothetical protein
MSEINQLMLAFLNATIEGERLASKWHGASYRFVQRYRSVFPENLGEELDAPFTRLDCVSRDRFDIQCLRPMCGALLDAGEWLD